MFHRERDIALKTAAGEPVPSLQEGQASGPVGSSSAILTGSCGIRGGGLLRGADHR